MKRLLLIVTLVLLLVACAKENRIMIKDEAPWFFPTILEINVGDTVMWDDTMSPVVHPIKTLSGPEELGSGHFKETWEYTFTEQGIYHYYCPVHPYMQGYIGVGMKV